MLTSPYSDSILSLITDLTPRRLTYKPKFEVGVYDTALLLFSVLKLCHYLPLAFTEVF